MVQPSPHPQNEPDPDSDRQADPRVEQWREVYQGCEAGLRSFLRGRLAQGVDVEDCLQAVCVKMVVQATRADDAIPAAARRAWLFRVAANEAAALWRRKAATEKMMNRHGGSDVADEDTSERVIRAEVSDKVQQALDSLPEPMQIVVRLRMEENLTFQQIADQLNIPLGTALTRMRRALERLKNEIESEERP